MSKYAAHTIVIWGSIAIAFGLAALVPDRSVTVLIAQTTLLLGVIAGRLIERKGTRP